jgi:hypothetical protein
MSSNFDSRNRNTAYCPELNRMTQNVLGGFAAAIFILCSVVGASPQQIDLGLYQAAEPKLKAAYDKQIESLKERYAAHVAEFKQVEAEYKKQGKLKGNWADQLDVDDWVKMLFHNETNIAISCAEDLKVSADDIRDGQSPAFKSGFVPCFHRRTEAMNMFFRIDNKLMNFRDDKFASLCEPKARLVNRESLKPYDFVKPKNPEALRLFNFGTYLTCIFEALGVPPEQFHIPPGMLKP